MIMRDVNAGYILRYTHANVASFFFIFVYAHIARGLFYSSYKAPRTLVWTIGVIIFIVMIATAFLGYKYSPKWFKFNNNSKISSNRSTPIVAAPLHIFLCGLGGGKTKNKKLPYIQQTLFCSRYSTNVSSNINLVTDKSLTLLNFIKDKNLMPVYSYENLQLETTKIKILNDTKGISGIYLILNKITLDYYIGSASTNRLYARFSEESFNLY